jgi:hypothetical protein
MNEEPRTRDRSTAPKGSGLVRGAATPASQSTYGFFARRPPSPPVPQRPQFREGVENPVDLSLDFAETLCGVVEGRVQSTTMRFGHAAPLCRLWHRAAVRDALLPGSAVDNAGAIRTEHPGAVLDTTRRFR